jgi:hypothetical protein
VFVILPYNGESVSVYIIHLVVFDKCKRNVVSQCSEDGAGHAFVASPLSAVLRFVTETKKTIYTLEVLNFRPGQEGVHESHASGRPAN